MKSLILAFGLIFSSLCYANSDIEVDQAQIKLRESVNSGSHNSKSFLKEISKGLAGKSNALSVEDTLELASRLLEDVDINPNDVENHWWKPTSKERKFDRKRYGEFLEGVQVRITDYLNKKSNNFKEADSQDLIKAARVGMARTGILNGTKQTDSFYVRPKSSERICLVSSRVLADLQDNDELLDSFENAKRLGKLCLIKSLSSKVRANKKELLLSILKIVATKDTKDQEDFTSQKEMIEALRPAIVKGLGYPEKEFNKIADLVNADKLHKQFEALQRTVAQIKVAEAKLRSPTENKCPIKDAEEGSPLIEQLNEHIQNQESFVAPLYANTEYQITSNYEPFRGPSTDSPAKKARSISSEPNIVEFRTYNTKTGIVETKDIVGRVVESKSSDQWHQYLKDLVAKATDVGQHADGTIYFTIAGKDGLEKKVGINFNVPLEANPVFYEGSGKSRSLFSFQPIL